MISVAEARAIVLAHMGVGETENVALGEALGRTLAAPIVARRAQPPFRASAMDGYAVRSADTPGRLRVIGEAGAGRALDATLGAGACARIFTGAPLPDGADAVLIQEDATRDGDAVIAPEVAANRHVRAAGVDFAAGQTLLAPPVRLTGPALALAAAAGRAELTVRRKPRIAVLAGGDEIVAPAAEPTAAQIFESASYGVAGMANTWGATATQAPPLPDSEPVIAAALDAALRGTDLVVVIGGASVGDRDHARAAAEAAGAELLFEKVALRPGKPTWFAVRDGKTVLGLPGNPTSAFVCARLFLRAAIEAMLGHDAAAASVTHAALLQRPLAANGARETYLRARTRRDDAGRVWVEAADEQDSSLIGVFAASDALILRAPHAPALEAGDIVQTLAI